MVPMDDVFLGMPLEGHYGLMGSNEQKGDLWFASQAKVVSRLNLALKEATGSELDQQENEHLESSGEGSDSILNDNFL